MSKQLTKRTYLGEGYIHYFRNDLTGEIVVVPCTQKEYEQLGEKDGSKYNPVMPGHTWVQSSGGTIKVDTLNSCLGDDEYCEIGNDVVAKISGEENPWIKVPKNKIKSKAGKDEIDDLDIINAEKL